MNLDDRIFSKFRVTFQISQATTAKRMKIDPYCQRQNCSPLNALFSYVYIQITLILMDVPPLWVYNQNTMGEKRRISTCILENIPQILVIWPQLLLKLSVGNRISLICCSFLCHGHSYTHCCRALTFASAKLSCFSMLIGAVVRVAELTTTAVETTLQTTPEPTATGK